MATAYVCKYVHRMHTKVYTSHFTRGKIPLRAVNDAAGK